MGRKLEMYAMNTGMILEVLENKISELERDNLRLKEYVNIFVNTIDGDECSYCPYADDDCEENINPKDKKCKFCEGMRQLGINI